MISTRLGRSCSHNAQAARSNEPVIVVLSANLNEGIARLSDGLPSSQGETISQTERSALMPNLI